MQGDLLRLGHRIGASTVWQMLNSVESIRPQAKGILAIDVLHIDTMFLRGSVKKTV